MSTDWIVSKHAAHRYATRILKLSLKISDMENYKIYKSIRDSIIRELDETSIKPKSMFSEYKITTRNCVFDLRGRAVRTVLELDEEEIATWERQIEKKQKHKAQKLL